MRDVQIKAHLVIQALSFHNWQSVGQIQTTALAMVHLMVGK